jgi:hypothetical protein
MCNCTSKGLVLAHDPGTTMEVGLLRGACHRAALCADPLARNDDPEIQVSCHHNDCGSDRASIEGSGWPTILASKPRNRL